MKTLRYVQSFVDRKSGTVYHYFRRPGYKRVPLPGLPGSREFMAAYQDALKEPYSAVVSLNGSEKSTATSLLRSCRRSSLP
jgi:hypothetical protein